MRNIFKNREENKNYPSNFAFQEAYDECFTLDPSRLGDALEKLSQPPHLHYIALLPKILNQAFVEVVTETLEKITKEDSDENKNDSENSHDINRLEPLEKTFAHSKTEIKKPQIHALINQFDEKPELVLQKLEKISPGTINRIITRAEEHAKAAHQAKVRFENIQEYLGIFLKTTAAFVILGCLVYSFIYDSFRIGWAVAFVIAYGITQSGTSGFKKIVESIETLLKERSSDKEKN